MRTDPLVAPILLYHRSVRFETGIRVRRRENMREKRLRWKASQRASERRGRIRADLESKGIAPEFSEPVANQLVDIAPDFSSTEYDAVLDGVAAAYGVHRRECGVADDVKEIQRLMLNFATELHKLEEGLQILSAYLQRMRGRALKGQGPTLH